MTPPYVCITGFDSSAQIPQLDQFSITRNYRIVCGILVSHKTFLGASKARYPAETELLELAGRIHKRKYLVALHYCPRDVEPDIAFEDVEEACSLMSPDLVQINSSNPPVIEAVVKALGSNPPEIVFQLNRTILNKFGDNHTEVMKYFKGVGGNDSRNHCLYDMSGGQGKDILDEGVVWDGELRLNSELRGLIGKHGLIPGAAGGMTALNIGRCLCEFGLAVSVDAESGVRDDENGLVMDDVNAFYRNACEVIGAG